MKRLTLIAAVTFVCLALAIPEAGARGGGGGARGGGGGGRAGGGARPGGGGGAARTPSMSRPAPSRPAPSRPGGQPSANRPSPSRPGAGPGAGANRPAGGANRPSAGNNRPNSGVNRPGTGGDRPGTGLDRPNAGVNRPGVGEGAGLPNRPGSSGRPSQGDVKDFLNLPGASQRPAGRPETGTRDRTDLANRDRADRDRADRDRADRDLADRDLADRANRDRVAVGDRNRVGDVNINAGNTVVANRQNNVTSVRNKWNNVENRPFDNNWWGPNNGHISDRAAWGWQQGWAKYPSYWCWRPCTWAAAGAWFGWAVSKPYNYDYGSTVVYRDNNVYVSDKQYASAEQYYEQADTIAKSLPEGADPESVEWMPLGVFAVTEQDGTDSGMVIQLAVSKEGIVAGTFYNDVTGSSRPLEGMVDQKSQRVAWRFADDDSSETVMETGIYNLTEDQATAFVHFGPDKTQTWLMVRLPDPERDAAGQ